MVRVTRVGCTVCTVTPGGTRRTTSAGALPAPRPEASTTAFTWPGASASRVETGPLRTTEMVCGSVSATRLLPRLIAVTATRGNGRVPTNGVTDTVTVDPVGRKSDVPAGRISPTLKALSEVRPLTSATPVSMWSIGAIASGSPRIVTAG